MKFFQKLEEWKKRGAAVVEVTQDNSDMIGSENAVEVGETQSGVAAVVKDGGRLVNALLLV